MKDFWGVIKQTGAQLRREIQQGQTPGFSDPYRRFNSVEEVRQAAARGVQIDVNQATVDDWLRLPGLSIHQARSLVTLSQSGVQFHCLEDIAAALGLPLHRLKPLEPILLFCYYDSDGLEGSQRCNPNQASVEMLARIPNLDPFLARRIVQNRHFYGPYRNLADLQRRLALPAAQTADLMHYLYF